MLSDLEIQKIFADKMAILQGHFVYASGRHGRVYVNKDAIYPDPQTVSELCREIANRARDLTVDTVVGPEKGGIILSQWTAFHLGVNAVYLEREESSFYQNSTSQVSETIIKGSGFEISARIPSGHELIDRGPGFEARRGHANFITGKNVLVVEDILTTGGSALRAIEAVRSLGGTVVGLVALCNRGGVTAEMVGSPPFFSALMNVQMDSWEEADCPMCQDGVPVNTNVGKGKAFVARTLNQQN